MLKKLGSMLTTSAAVALLAAAPGLAVAHDSDQGSTDEPQAQATMQHGMQGSMHDHMQGHDHMQSDAKADADDPSAMGHDGMMDHMQQMQAMRLQQQAELEDLVGRMNAATGEQQQQLMAELLSKLVEARGTTTSMPMHAMMPGMMESMHSGGHGGMADCPMMKGGHDGASDEKPADTN